MTFCILDMSKAPSMRAVSFLNWYFNQIFYGVKIQRLSLPFDMEAYDLKAL